MADPSTGTFRPLEQPDRRLHGHTAILVSGQLPAEEARLREALAQRALTEIPFVCVYATDADQPLGALAARPPASPRPVPAAAVGPATSPDNRAVVLSGLTESQLHAVMAAYKSCQLPPALWATVTTTTESWTWRKLLQELLRERQALGNALRKPDSAKP